MLHGKPLCFGDYFFFLLTNHTPNYKILEVFRLKSVFNFETYKAFAKDSVNLFFFFFVFSKNSEGHASLEEEDH